MHSIQIMRECLHKNLHSLSEVIFTHDDLYNTGEEGVDDKNWN